MAHQAPQVAAGIPAPAIPDRQQMLMYQLHEYPDVPLMENDLPIPDGIVENNDNNINTNIRTMRNRAERIIMIQNMMACHFSLAHSIRLTESEICNARDLLRFTEADIYRIEKKYTDTRAPAANRIAFGASKTRLLVGFIHHAQDQHRLGQDVYSQIQHVDEDHFEKALENKAAREDLADKQTITSSSADPGKLIRNNQWHAWHNDFKNYLCSIPGSQGHPLDYVIREETYTLDDVVHDDYLSKLSKLGSHNSDYFKSDKRLVYQLLHGKVSGGPGEEWIKQHTNDGRQAWFSLKAHFDGGGNTQVRVEVAEKMYNTLHYKSEKAMPFATFTTRALQMWQIFDEVNEPKIETARLRWLQNAVQDPLLSSARSSINTQYITGNITYSEAVNVYANEIAARQPVAQSLSQTQSTDRKPAAKTMIRSGRGNNPGRGYGGKNNHSSGRSSNQRGQSNYSSTKSGNNNTGSYRLPSHVWKTMTQDERHQYLNQQRNNKPNNGPTSTVSTVTSNVSNDDVIRAVSQLQGQLQGTIDNISVVTTSDTTNAGSQFGGRSGAENNKKQRISQLKTSNRRVVSQTLTSAHIPVSQSVHGRIELDSHADTCVLGKNFIVIKRNKVYVR